MGDTLIEPGGLMERIQTLIAPPRCEEKTRGRRTGSSYSPPSDTPLLCPKVTRGKNSNHDRCDGCKEGGDLVCCDRCPAAFHLYCCDPPLEAGSLPSGEWLCRKCNPPELPQELRQVNKPFQSLLERDVRENPVSFSLPSYLLSNSPLGLGPRKRRRSGEESRGKHARSEHKEVKQPDHLDGDQTNRRFCALCSQTSRVSLLMQCNFCPLSYHMDCLDPPRTSPPLGSWMCPCHAEHLHPDFSSEFLSTKEKLLDKMRTDFSEHTVKIDFLDKVHRMKHYGRRVSHTKRRTVHVPLSIKHMYKSPLPEDGVAVPSFAELCEAASRARNATNSLRPIQRVTYDRSALDAQQEQDEWLRSVIHLQSDIVRFLSLHLDVQPCMRQSQPSQPIDVTPPDRSKPAIPSRILPDCKKSHNEHPIENGLLSDSDSDSDGMCEDPPYKPHKKGSREVKTQDKPTMNGWSDRDSPGIQTDSVSEEKSNKRDNIFASSQKAVLLDHGYYTLPDLSLLEADLVKFLAQQRLQQLLTTDSRQTVGELVSSPSHVPSTAGTEDVLSRQPPADVLTRCHAVLCPLGCPGRLYPMRKKVVTLGSSSSCDVPLSHLKSCSRLSETHACLIYNKSVTQFELINYSEYGTVVDGVLYLSAHCDSNQTSHGSSSLTSNHVKALGQGPRASRAQRRIDLARKKWKDSNHSKMFMNAIMKMSEQENGSASGINSSVSTNKSVSPLVQTHTHSGSGRLRRDSFTNNGGSEKVTKVPDVNSGHLKHNLRPRVKNEGSVQSQLDLRRSRETGGAGQLVRTEGQVGTVSSGLCGCAGLQPLNTDGGWSGSAPLSHGSLIRIGCVQLLLSVAGQPGHAELIQSIVSL